MSVISLKNKRLVRDPPATKQDSSFTEERRAFGFEFLVMTTRFLFGRREFKSFAVVEPTKTVWFVVCFLKRGWSSDHPILSFGDLAIKPSSVMAAIKITLTLFREGFLLDQ